MAVDKDKLVRSARALLTSEDTALKLPISDFYAVIPIALQEWHRVNEAKDKPRKITATTANIGITAGVADVRSAIELVGIDVDSVRDAEIYISYAKTPPLFVRFVNSRDRINLTGVQDQHFINAYFDGDKMYFQPVNGTPLNSVNFTITAPSKTVDTANLPADIQGELSLILADLMRKYNTDTEHKGIAKRLMQN